MNNEEITKFLDGAGQKVKHGLDNLTITPNQARHAGVMGQMGGTAGTLTGAVIGTGIGALTHHPAQGAGIGAMAGGALGAGTGAALGIYSGRPKGPAKPKPPVTKPKKQPLAKSFTHPTQDTQHKVAQGGLGIAAVADAAGASAAWKETRRAVKPALSTIEGVGPKVKAIAGYAKEKAAFPIVAGGIAATAVAEHVMHESKKNQAPKPPKGITPMSKSITSADEVFAKARGQYSEDKHKRARDGRFSSVAGASLLGSGTMAAHLSDGAKHIGQELELHGRRVQNESDGVLAGGQTAKESARVHRDYGSQSTESGRLANFLEASGDHQLGRGRRLGRLGEDALKGGQELAHAGRIGTKVGVGAAAAGLGLGAYGTYRQLKSRQAVKKNDEISSDVEAIFAKAREDVSKLERETKTGLKRGAIGGAALGAGIGAGRGLRLAHGMPGRYQAVSAVGGAVGGALRYGAIAGAAGGAVGSIQASARKKAVKALQNKPEQPEEVGKSWAALATEGQKAVGAARGVTGFHAANIAHAVSDPVNRAAVKGVASFHAGNIAHKIGGMSTGAKVGSAAGASFLAGAAALHHHMSSQPQD